MKKNCCKAGILALISGGAVSLYSSPSSAIEGGQKLEPGMWPTVAIWGPSSPADIAAAPQFEQICSGIKISSNTILTAAHCFSHEPVDLPWTGSILENFRVEGGDLGYITATALPNGDLSAITREIQRHFSERQSWLDENHHVLTAFKGLLGKLRGKAKAPLALTPWEHLHYTSAVVGLRGQKLQQIHFHPRYRGPIVSPDLAIVELATSSRESLVGKKPAAKLGPPYPWLKGSGALWTAGFGLSSAEPEFGNGLHVPRPLRGLVQTDLMNDPQFEDSLLSSKSSSTGTLTIVHPTWFPGFLCPGDSGSGLLWKTSLDPKPNDFYVLGILSNAESKGGCLGHGADGPTRTTWSIVRPTPLSPEYDESM